MIYINQMAIEIQKTASDYLKEQKDLQNSLIRLDALVSNRLYTLAKLYPDAIINRISNTDIMAKNIISLHTAEELSFDQRLVYIQKIEEYIESLNKYIQGKLF